MANRFVILTSGIVFVIIYGELFSALTENAKGNQVKNPQDRLDEILDKLRQSEFRITPQRIAILKAFLYSDEHPSVERVYEQVRINFPTTSLATVYKNIALLKELGEALELGAAALDSTRQLGWLQRRCASGNAASTSGARPRVSGPNRKASPGAKRLSA